MARLILSLCLLLLPEITPAAIQQIRLSDNTAHEAFTVDLQADDARRSVVRLRLAEFELEQELIAGAPYQHVRLGDRAQRHRKGVPALPVWRESLIIPDDRKMSVRILSAEYRDFADIDVAPAKGSIPRSVDPASVPYVFDAVYARNAWFPEHLADLGAPYIMRDVRGLVLEINPFQYNPATRTLRVYTDITVELASDGPGDENVLTRKPARRSQEFEKLYARHFLNYTASGRRYEDVSELGRMLVICHDAFSADMQPFLDWKNQLGIPCELVDVSTVGATGEQIKAYIQNIYYLEGLTYILLVGDAAQVPYLTVQNASDPSYSLLAGDDDYPDAFVGRMSAETPEQLLTQIERSIEYERDPQPDAAWYERGTGIASHEGPGDDDELDNEHIDNIRLKLEAFTYTHVDTIYDPYANSLLVTNALNEGRSCINYCGHGGMQGWGSSGFNNDAVNDLVNDHMLPFITSVACNTGEFEGGTCFGEAWLRATNGGEPSGGIAFYGSTISQGWSPPMCAQDEFVDLLVDEVKRCYGTLCYLGSCQMMDEYGDSGVNEFKHWTVFGDPSLRVRTAPPAPISVAHAHTVNPLLPSFPVQTEPGNLATLSFDGRCIDSAFADAGGEASIPLSDELPPPGTHVTLTVTGFNRQTHIGTVLVGDGMLPDCEVSPAFFTVTMLPDEQREDWFHITNAGEAGSTLFYFISVSDPNYPGVGGGNKRDMSGSYAWCDAESYYAGESAPISFHLINGSLDSEFVGRFTLNLPPGVQLLADPGPLTGGSGGDIPYVGEIGDGAFCDWNVDSWPMGGVILPGEIGNVTLDLGFDGASGDLVLPYVIYGDIYGGEPHEIAGEILIVDAGPTVRMLSPNGGESLAIGTEHRISFWGAGGPTHVRVELNRVGIPGGGEWELLADDVPLEQAGIDWVVTGPISADCAIKISDVDDPGVVDFSDAPFTIYRPLTWVAVGSESGSVSAGETTTIPISFDSGGLPDGLFEAEIRIDSNAEAPVLLPVSITVTPDPTAVESPSAALFLAQNHPNPFNPSTMISFRLLRAQDVRLDVFDVSGQRVRQLLVDALPAGGHHVIWDGRNDASARLASGVYFCRLETAERSLSRKMLLLK